MPDQVPLTPIPLSQRLAASSRQASRSALLQAAAPAPGILSTASLSSSLAGLQLSGRSLKNTVSNAASSSMSRANSIGATADSPAAFVKKHDGQVDMPTAVSSSSVGAGLSSVRTHTIPVDLFASAKALHIAAHE